MVSLLFLWTIRPCMNTNNRVVVNTDVYLSVYTYNPTRYKWPCCSDTFLKITVVYATVAYTGHLYNIIVTLELYSNW